MSKRGFGSLVTGLAIGAGVGLLFAPKKGSETRKDLTDKMNELLDKVKSLEYEDVKKSIEVKIADLKKELEDLDKEKVAKIARQKAQEIQKKAEELYNLAVEKGTPVLEKAASEVRTRTIDFLNSTVSKLEKAEKNQTKSVKK